MSDAVTRPTVWMVMSIIAAGMGIALVIYWLMGCCRNNSGLRRAVVRVNPAGFVGPACPELRFTDAPPGPAYFVDSPSWFHGV